MGDCLMVNKEISINEAEIYANIPRKRNRRKIPPDTAREPRAPFNINLLPLMYA